MFNEIRLRTIYEFGILENNILYLNKNKSSWVEMYLLPENMSDVNNFEELWNIHPLEQKDITVFGKKTKEPRYVESYGNVDYVYSGRIHKKKKFQKTLKYILSLQTNILYR
uniref:Uncharacterized protein n=1 Tax=Pithovirus LCDPAC02 TaxID=2506601 RepID=A0A481YNV8_9VIRU|nr:MAG: hypothetical protein LCDPAC02_02120 [Pithovirus LCDPAC02]